MAETYGSIPTQAMPIYLDRASKMVEEILANDPINQNEMLNEIFNRIKRDRTVRIEKAAKDLEYLNDTYRKLITIGGKEQTQR